ncbi:porin [Billgrantia azerbaijanica]|nr:porin [Halomonas azerbaijanica]
MKKTLLATAIAGAMAASGAQAATVYNQEGTKLDLYGNIQLTYYSVDNGDESVDELADNGSTFGFAAEHVISETLTGYMKLEFDDFKADEMKVAGRDAGDQAYVGLKGNFGDGRLGSYDSLIDDWVQDPITNNEFFDVSDSNSRIGGINETDKFTYTSPSLGGFQFALGTQYKGEAEGENVSDSGNASFFGGLKYAVGAFSVAAVYDNLDNYAEAFGPATGGNAATPSEGDFGDQYGVTAQYTMGALRLAAKAEKFDSDFDDDDAEFYALGARYGYGLGDVYGAYQRVDDERETDERDEVIAGATYNLSDAMYTWVEAAFRDQEDDVGDGAAVGVTYLF